MSWSLMRGLDPANPSKQPDSKSIKCLFSDFEHALLEVHPSFGANEAEFERFVTYGMIPYGPRYNMLLQTGIDAVERVRSSENAGVMSVLLEGPLGTGKSALAAKLALTAVEEKGFPFAKLISSEDFVGMSEAQKAGKITQFFEDAYKSELSCLILDDIERLVEYVKIGPRFSNVILQVRASPADAHAHRAYDIADLVLAGPSRFIVFFWLCGAADAASPSCIVHRCCIVHRWLHRAHCMLCAADAASAHQEGAAQGSAAAYHRHDGADEHSRAHGDRVGLLGHAQRADAIGRGDQDRAREPGLYGRGRHCTGVSVRRLGVCHVQPAFGGYPAVRRRISFEAYLRW